MEPQRFERLVREHSRALYRAARAILRDEAAAEDAVQEAWMRAYRAIDSFRGEANVRTWLIRIVVNEALGRRRKQLPQPHAPAELAAAEESQPEAMAQRGELRRRLQADIGVLPKRFRDVFLLRAVEQRSVRETALALRIPESTVRTRFFRARSQLRHALS